MTEVPELKSRGLVPQSMTEAMQMSEMLAKSEIIPKHFKGRAGDILVAIQWGLEVGLPPLQALQNIAVINGRPSMWGDAVLALVRSSGKLERIDERDDGETATCRVKRKGEPEVVRTFSMADAKQAGLINKQGPWTQYPKRMRQMRSRAFAMRDVFPDVLAGISVAEEVQDITETIEKPQAQQLPKQPEPLDKEVGNMLLDYCHGNVGMMKAFVIQTLEWPEDTKLSGKWMQDLTEDDLLVVKDRIQHASGKDPQDEKDAQPDGQTDQYDGKTAELMRSILCSADGGPKPDGQTAPLWQALLDHYQGDVAAIEAFAIQTLEWPEDTVLPDGWFAGLGSEETAILQAKVRELGQPGLFDAGERPA